MALNRVKSISALSAHSAVKGLMFPSHDCLNGLTKHLQQLYSILQPEISHNGILQDEKKNGNFNFDIFYFFICLLRICFLQQTEFVYPAKLK